MDIDDLTGSHKVAALVTAMGGQYSDIHHYDKYLKADLTFTSIEKGWEGYQKEIDDAGKVTGSELTQKVLVDLGYDTDNDGKISKEEVQAITGELDLSNQNLTDVSILKDLSDKVTTINLSTFILKAIIFQRFQKISLKIINNWTGFLLQGIALQRLGQKKFQD